MKQLEYKVYPSNDMTISVDDDDIYGGAHTYMAQMSTGFNNGKADYIEEEVLIPFIKKDDDGTIHAGLQSEQLVYIILDRTIKLNNRFPSAENRMMIMGLEMFLEACQDRVAERMSRGVMGNLKK